MRSEAPQNEVPAGSVARYRAAAPGGPGDRSRRLPYKHAQRLLLPDWRHAQPSLIETRS